METLGTRFLPASMASALSSTQHFIACSYSGGSSREGSSIQRTTRTTRPSCHSAGRQEEHVWSKCSTTRRQVLKLAHRVIAGVGVAIVTPNFALAADEKVKTYRNIEDARIAGERLREIKDAADGPVITSSSGIRYRELERGAGKPIGPGDWVSVYYTISRLNGYYLDSVGYGKEGKNDVGETLNFQYGRGMVPEAIEGGMEGMQVGARRRILVTPERGWVSPDLLPKPTSFFAERRLSERKATQALLIEVELVKAKPMND